jgi:hypothetical protein
MVTAPHDDGVGDGAGDGAGEGDGDGDGAGAGGAGGGDAVGGMSSPPPPPQPLVSRTSAANVLQKSRRGKVGAGCPAGASSSWGSPFMKVLRGPGLTVNPRRAPRGSSAGNDAGNDVRAAPSWDPSRLASAGGRT